MKTIVLLLSLIGVLAAQKLRFDGHKLVELRIDSVEQMTKMLELEISSDQIRFLDSPTSLNKTAVAVVSPTFFPTFLALAKSSQISVLIVEQNFQKLLDLESPPRKGKADRFDWTSYYTLEEMYEWLDVLGSTYPDKVTLFDLGTSYEGRTIRGIKISSQKAGNRAIFIESHIHANEWITSATCTWFINQLLTSQDPEVIDLAENIDWHIIPVLNVDGFSYTRSHDRLWRKTRSVHSLLCVGVDPNRNFAFNYMLNGGASSVKCHNYYAGPQPFSEPETRALNDFYATVHAQVDVYLAFHSFANMLLYPYGHTLEPAQTAAALRDIGQAAVDALEMVYGNLYELGTPPEILYTASGTSVDHMYGAHNTPVAYTYEFRNREFGQILPPEFIVPNAEEVLASLIALVAKTREFGYLGGAKK